MCVNSVKEHVRKIQFPSQLKGYKRIRVKIGKWDSQELLYIYLHPYITVCERAKIGIQLHLFRKYHHFKLHIFLSAYSI